MKQLVQWLKNHWEMPAIFAGSFLLRFFYTFGRLPHRDALFYVEAAREKDGAAVYGPSDSLPPLFHYILVAANAFSLPVYETGLAVNLLAGSAVVVGVYLISLELFARKHLAWGAALLAATHPGLIEYSATAMRDAPYHCCFVFAVYFGIRLAKYQTVGSALMYGVLGALAILFRKEGVELLVILIVWLGVSVFVFPQENRLRRLSLVFISTVTFFLILISVCAGIYFADKSPWLFHLVGKL